MQQATVNLFADMGVQPTTLMPGLTPQRRRPTRPHRRPRSPLRRPAPACPTVGRDHQRNRHRHRRRLVAGVEVSTDGGPTWHPVTGMSTRAPRSPGPTPGSRTETRRPRSGPARSTTAATSRLPARDDGQRQLPLLDLGTALPQGRRSVTRRRSRSASSSDRHPAPSPDPVLQGHRQHRYAHRKPVDLERPMLATATFTGETASGWQLVSFSGPSLNMNRPTSPPTTLPGALLLRRRDTCIQPPGARA